MVLVVFVTLLLALALGPSIYAGIIMRKTGVGPDLARAVAPYLPVSILAMCVLVVVAPSPEAAIAFSPAEINFLFPAPFRRRELLIFKLTKLLLGSIVVALGLATTCSFYFNQWLQSFTGIFLTIAFIQLITVVIALSKQIVTEKAYTFARKALLTVAGACIAIGLAQVLLRVRIESAVELIRFFEQTWTGWFVLAPFKIFSRTIMATTLFPELIGWGAAATAIDVLLVTLVLKLDANYLEASATISQELYTRMERARRSGGFALPPKATTRLRIPSLPWLDGVGPVLWRQLLIALRTSGIFVFFAFVVSLAMIGLAVMLPRDKGQVDVIIAMIGMTLLTYLPLVFSMNLPWAFRGDIDHMDALKTLPVRPMALVAGELGGGVLILTAIQLAVFVVILAATGRLALVVAGASFLVPYDAMLFGVSNALFLLYPIRPLHSGAPDFAQMGRSMFQFVLQGLILLPCLGVPAAIGALVYFLSGLPWPVAALAAWIALAAELPVLLWVLAQLFERFDPSIETPE